MLRQALSLIHICGLALLQIRSHGDVSPGGALPNRPLERQQEPRDRPGVLGAEKRTGRAGQAERSHDCRRYHVRTSKCAWAQNKIKSVCHGLRVVTNAFFMKGIVKVNGR